MDTATISIISSAIVAIAALLVPAFVTVFNERAKWRREQHAARVAQLDTATTTLADSLAPFRTHVHLDSGKQATYYTAALSNYYRWKYLVWPYLTSAEHGQVDGIHTILEREAGAPSALLNYASGLVTEIIALGDTARLRVDKQPPRK